MQNAGLYTGDVNYAQRRKEEERGDITESIAANKELVWGIRAGLEIARNNWDCRVIKIAICESNISGTINRSKLNGTHKRGRGAVGCRP